jgi:hypothetical protein
VGGDHVPNCVPFDVVPRVELIGEFLEESVEIFLGFVFEDYALGI